ncbi:hypothetical protein EV192_104237 [Actinocrispum wychmicini]|uniref:Uncharacterized protein n=1 Tax=Actinocrispum wychmicini TaxID=1213861 RepID=A0A4R2JQD5_9PSEU|nr:hypothetical protein EV192_104237 [Actinocrispum wychmicini]
MKFWQLVSVCRDEPELMERLAGGSEWNEYLEWFRDFARLVRDGDRSRLDAELPTAACVHVLSASRLELFESGRYLRSRRAGPADRKVTAVEVLSRYGGAFLEDLLEAGLARLPDDANGRPG